MPGSEIPGLDGKVQGEDEREIQVFMSENNRGLYGLVQSGNSDTNPIKKKKRRTLPDEKLLKG